MSALALLAVSAVVAPTAAWADAASYTWTGAAPTGTNWSNSSGEDWSNSSNWEGGNVPSGAVGILSFPRLTGVCAPTNGGLPTEACGLTNNDIAGLSAQGISIGDTSGDTPSFYGFNGNGLTIGSGGITLAAGGDANFHLPLTLEAPQTWLVNGQLNLDRQVGGSANPLGVEMTQHGEFNIDESDVEVGPFTATGPGTVSVGQTDSTPPELLNYSDGNAVNFTAGATLAIGTGYTGPIAMRGSVLTFGGFNAATPQLTVAGSVALDSTTKVRMQLTGGSSVPPPRGSGGTQGAQLASSLVSATGDVSLGNARLEFTGGPCAPPRMGDVVTVVSTAGALHGTFGGLPKDTVPVPCRPRPVIWGLSIAYHTTGSPQTVTGTVVPIVGSPTRSPAVVLRRIENDIAENSSISPREFRKGFDVQFAFVSKQREGVQGGPCNTKDPLHGPGASSIVLKGTTYISADCYRYIGGNFVPGRHTDYRGLPWFTPSIWNLTALAEEIQADTHISPASFGSPLSIRASNRMAVATFARPSTSVAKRFVSKVTLRQGRRPQITWK